MKKLISILLIALLTVACIITAFADNYSNTASGSPGTLNAKSAVILDRSTGKIIWGKNSKTRMYTASTTKIMTALLALEYGNAKDTITVGSEIGFSEEDASKAGLVKGQKISLENLIRGLMLPSGGEAAYTAAVYTARKASKKSSMKESEAISYFCKMMNKKAAALGAKSTHFTNPDGYHDENHYSTAYDLALISKAAMKYKLFRTIVSTQTYRIKEWTVTNGKAAAGDKYLIWKNTNKLLDKKGSYYYKYTTGIKTGYTSDAGYCLASAATKGTKNIITVVLDSTVNGVWTDSKKVLDYGLGIK